MDVIHSATLLQHGYLRVNLRHSRREYWQLKLGHDLPLYQSTPSHGNKPLSGSFRFPGQTRFTGRDQEF